MIEAAVPAFCCPEEMLHTFAFLWSTQRLSNSLNRQTPQVCARSCKRADLQARSSPRCCERLDLLCREKSCRGGTGPRYDSQHRPLTSGRRYQKLALSNGSKKKYTPVYQSNIFSAGLLIGRPSALQNGSGKSMGRNTEFF